MRDFVADWGFLRVDAVEIRHKDAITKSLGGLEGIHRVVWRQNLSMLAEEGVVKMVSKLLNHRELIYQYSICMHAFESKAWIVPM